MMLSGGRPSKSVADMQGTKNGETARLAVGKENLPGLFVLRFDYREKESSTPYPSEKSIFISNQDLELWVNPMFCNNGDSTRFQQDERENAAFLRFSKEKSRRKEKIGLLQNFLINYDDAESSFYKMGIDEYEQRRQIHNTWLKTSEQEDKALFISNLYSFQHIPEIALKGDETDRINSLINHYFDGMDFTNPLLIKLPELNRWMDNYVNLYGQLSTTVALRASLFPRAGANAIKKAKQVDPLVYGWMVDYFYRGYETNGINAGMKVLEPYLNDPNCLTAKRQEIARRLKGMEMLIPGTRAPDIAMKDTNDRQFNLNTFETPGKYILVLFWSADCSHCVEMTNLIYPWQQQAGVHPKVTVVAISLDETSTEIQEWKKKAPQMKGWKHLRAPDGIRSKAASDYYVLATPVMVLLDAKIKMIVALPNTLSELIKAM